MTLERALRELRDFAALPDTEREALAHAMDDRRLEAGQIVVKQGSRADGWYIVLTGRAVVRQDPGDGTKIDVADLGPGDSFGALALLNPATRAATVEASSDLRVAVLPRRAFDLLYGHADPSSVRFQLLVARQLAREARLVTEALLDQLEGGMDDVGVRIRSLSVDF